MNTLIIGSGFGLYGYLPSAFKFSKKIYLNNKYEKIVKKRKNLKSSIKEMINSKKPYFLEVCVEKEANVFPMIPSGTSVSDVRLE